jgi:hypothetical protein
VKPVAAHSDGQLVETPENQWTSRLLALDGGGAVGNEGGSEAADTVQQLA